MGIVVGRVGGELRLKGLELELLVGFVDFGIRVGGRRIGGGGSGVLGKVGHWVISIDQIFVVRIGRKRKLVVDCIHGVGRRGGGNEQSGVAKEQK